MTGILNLRASGKLITEDIAWLERAETDCLERRHYLSPRMNHTRINRAGR